MGKKLFLFAAAAVALASCTETDLSGDTSFAKESTSDAIQFSAKTGNAGTTRTGTAGTITTASLKTGTHKDDGFGVMGYQTTADLTIPLTTGQTPNFMFNQQVKWADASGVWTYSPVKYWPNGIDKANDDNSPSNTAISTNTDRLSFFAYAPWVDVVESDYTSSKIVTDKALGAATAKNMFYATGNSKTTIDDGIVAFTANTVDVDPQVFYYMPNADVKQAVDLLWGLRGTKQYMESDKTNNPETPLENLGNSYNINLFKQTVPETVSFLFKHALSKIGGNTKSTTSTTGIQKCGLKVVVDVDANGNGINGVDNQSKYLGTGSNFDNTSTLVTIKSVKVQDGASAWADRTTNKIPDDPRLYSNLKNSGWFDLATGTWSDVTIVDNKGDKVTPENTAPGSTYNITADRTGEYQINPDIVEPETDPAVKTTDKTKWETGDGIPNGVTTEAKNVYSDATDVPSLLMIPAAAEQTLYVTVDYLVRTADPKLSTGYSEVEQIVTNKVSLAGLDVNKYYTLVMHLGLTSVKFSAIVTDWTTTDDATYDEGGVDEGTNPSAEEVWLPSNVINATTETTSATGTASNVNTAANTTTYTIKLSGLAAGEKIIATKSGNISKVEVGTTDIATEYTLQNADVTTGKADIKVTLTPNTKVSAVSNLITITQKNNAGTVLTTTTVNIVQSAFDIVLTQANGVVTVKDADGVDANLSDSKYTVKVLDSEGVELTKDTHYTVSSPTITMTADGTYTVIVTYTDGDSKKVTKTIKTTKVTPTP